METIQLMHPSMYYDDLDLLASAWHVNQCIHKMIYIRQCNMSIQIS